MCHRRRQRRESAQRMPAWRGGGLHGPRRRSAPHVTRRSATQCTPGRTGPAGSAGCGYAGRRVDTTTSYASRGGVAGVPRLIAGRRARDRMRFVSQFGV